MADMWKEWWLSQYDVRIGAAETERVHAGQAFAGRFREWLDRRRNAKL
jgi:hypothetical protein